MRNSRSQKGMRASNNTTLRGAQIATDGPSKSLNKCRANKSSRQLSQVEILQHHTKPQSIIAPNTADRVEISTCQPSTTQATNTDIPNNHTSNVRASQVTMDLHEALRFQLPPFQQSKQWTKQYMNEKDDIVPCLSTSALFSKELYSPTCNSQHQTNTPSEPDIVGTGENDTAHYGLCQFAHLPGWQVWKQRRQPKRLSASPDITKIVRPRSIQRRKPTKFLKARVHDIQCRITVPRAVQSRCRAAEENQGLVTSLPTSLKTSRQGSEFLCSLFPNQTVFSQEWSNSSVSSLHDFEKVKRFSQECVDMLSGLDFGEEWRLSFINPDFSLPWRSALEIHSPIEQTSKPDNKPIHGSKTTTQRADKPSQFLALDAEEQPTAAKTEHLSQPIDTLCKTVSLSHKSSFDPVEDETGSCDQGSTPCLYGKVGNAAFKPYRNYLGDQNYVSNLSNTRSVDTLTEIEAQVDAPHMVTYLPAEKESSFTLSSSPNRQQPLGDPPGRPLPSIPVYESSDNRSEIHKCSSFTSSHRNKVILDALELVDPFKSISTRPATRISNGSLPMTIQSKNGDKTREVSQTSKHRLRALNPPSTSIQSHVPNNDENRLPEQFALKEVEIRQNRTDQVIQSRNIAAWNKSQETFSSSSWEAGTGQSITSIESEPQRTGSLRKTLTQKPALRSAGRKLNGSQVLAQRYPVQNCSGQRTILIHRNPSADDVSATKRTGISREVGGTKSRASPSHQNLANQCKKLQTAVSLPHLHQRTRQSGRSKQPLGNSQIMVVVDTNPHTSAFRAGALSPCPSSMASEKRPTTPLCDMAGRQLVRGLSSPLIEHGYTTPVASSGPTETIDIVKPPSSVRNRQSPRGPKFQGKPTQGVTPNIVKQIPERISSAKAASLSSSRRSRTRILDGSDSNQGDSPLTKGNYSSGLRARNKLIPSQPNFQIQKDIPLTSRLKAEVRNADKEYEDLKKYEKRIEQLQQHLEQTMKVWGRMSRNSKRQYLTSTIGSVDQKCNTCARAQFQNKDDDIASLATSSVYTRGSNVQRMHEAISESFNEALEFTQRALDESRHVTGTLPLTMTCINTDIENEESTGSDDSSVSKQTSGASLTDPQDFDLPPSSPSHHFTSRACVAGDQALKQKRNNLSSSTLNNFRARLQASRPLGMMTRRHRSQAVLRDTGANAIEIRPATGLAAVKMPLAERFAIAPWERLEHPQRDYIVETSANAEQITQEMDNPFLELSDETLSTDQMDAMLGL